MSILTIFGIILQLTIMIVTIFKTEKYTAKSFTLSLHTMNKANKYSIEIYCYNLISRPQKKPTELHDIRNFQL
ncbi:hypothetical protein DERP_005617 [Dermatophagoides pteronyssinus]|uniref:Uncharacterized protein n=1 Tax=Dermatophagoides pteronyssinus TaxID=6956 RepID=A0ABQ8J965_DERPT|nr:hypothetical protein DERP_005617 [Dermatophagoides pteronyssinus]